MDKETQSALRFLRVAESANFNETENAAGQNIPGEMNIFAKLLKIASFLKKLRRPNAS